MATDANLQKLPQLPIDVLISPFRRFVRLEAAGGIVLLATTVIALVWANSPWEYGYHAFWNARVTVGLGRFALTETRHAWLNDGLMSVFFFLVGLEIKRELLVGELSSLRQAAFPFIAAVGGTVIPALVYLALNTEVASRGGWGIPMATDIAFALGVLLLLGKKLPPGIRVFVTALAIIDDILAVIVIALFYTPELRVASLMLAFMGVAVSFAANLLGVRRPSFYAAIGVLIWVAVFRSGVHATVAGVLLAFTIPARTYIDRERFIRRSRSLLDRFAATQPHSFEEHSAINTLETQCEMVESPLHRIEHYLTPWVSLLLMPLFALANAGVHVLGTVSVAASNPVALGVALGLFLGKPVGIFTFAWLFAKLRLAAPPQEVTWTQIFGVSSLCGIGFTTSLFIANLAFGDGILLTMAKIGILAGSLAAGICGSLILIMNSASTHRVFASN